MKFGDNLKLIRKSRKISQEDLAEKLGVSRQSVSKWETGENYPSMNNIICLCDTLKCKMNELVHEDFTDINSLDEEIKMSVAKLNKEKQERVKLISNILSIFGKVAGIVIRVGIGFIVVSMILLPLLIINIKVTDNKITTLDHRIKISERKNGVIISYNDNIKFIELNKKDISNLKYALRVYSNKEFILLMEVGFVFMIAFLVLIIKLLKHLELLFQNIHDGDTPFTLENANHIKMMSYLMIACIILSAISQTLLNIAFAKEDVFDFRTFNIIEIFILYLFAYLFEYGYEIQLDSKGKIYDDNK